MRKRSRETSTQLFKLALTFIATGGATFALIAVKELSDGMKAFLWVLLICGGVIMIPDLIEAVQKIGVFIESQKQRADQSPSWDDPPESPPIPSYVPTYEPPQPAPPVSIDWEFTNSSGETLFFEFWQRGARIRWPEAGKSYFINPGQTLSGALGCNQSQVVCFGAWNRSDSRSWGMGRDQRNSCQGCCRPCGGSFALNLNR